jgi:hypothetical protein
MNARQEKPCWSGAGVPSAARPLRGQLGRRQPEIPDGVHEAQEVVPFHWLDEVAVCLKVIDLPDIRFRIGNAQDEGRDLSQSGAC